LSSHRGGDAEAIALRPHSGESDPDPVRSKREPFAYFVKVRVQRLAGEQVDITRTGREFRQHRAVAFIHQQHGGPSATPFDS
jgi:hypothetical protein